jgi:uncharacterized protein (TIGR02646 family)
LVHLVRQAEPKSLTRYRAKWTARWSKCLSQGRTIGGWATPAARRALQAPLLALSHGKCAFCEGILNLTSFIEIEHYHAKTVRHELVFDWDNLFPSCGICNRTKGDLDHQGRLLKPDRDDPESFLWLNPDNGELEPSPLLDAEQSQRVLATIAAYGLQRGALCAQRIEMMKFVNRWIARAAGVSASSPECQEEWNYLIRPSTPWKFVIRHTLTLKGLERLAEIDRSAFLGLAAVPSAVPRA